MRPTTQGAGHGDDAHAGSPLARALGMTPNLALRLADLDLTLAVWRQRDRYYEIPALTDPVISIHVGGRGRVRFGDGDGWSRRSSTLGTVTFLPPGLATRWLVEGGEVEHLSLTIGAGSRLRTVVTAATDAIEVGMPDALNVGLAQTLVSLLDDATEAAPPDPAFLLSLCETLLRHFARQHRTPYRDARAGAGHEAVAHAITLIEARYAEPLTVAGIAAGSGLSAAYFGELFKRETGRSPHQYLLQVRIERVRDALRATDLALGDIAQNFGFASQSHLNTAFRKWMGVTPAQYRSRQRA
jgi:AraC family transcriptional regulator